MDKLQELIDKHRDGGGSVIGLLQDIHQESRYLSEEALERVSGGLDVPLSTLYGLVTFYKSFRLEPVGKCHVCVCVGTACHVNGADRIVEAMEQELGIEAGQTTEDQSFTLETVNCVGACALGPLATVNGEYHGKLDAPKARKLIRKQQKG